MAELRQRLGEGELPYTMHPWRDQSAYQCRFCPYDTLVEEQAWEHYRAHHAPRPHPLHVLVADKGGRPLNTLVEEG